MSRIENLTAALELALGGKLSSVTTALGEVTAVVKADDLLAVTTALRDVAELRFEQLLDLCGVDYSAYGGVWEGQRYAVVYHLLSLTHNWRLRLRTFARDDDLPVLESVIGVWPAANWYEREAFDLFGIVFTGHPDLRRLLERDPRAVMLAPPGRQPDQLREVSSARTHEEHAMAAGGRHGHKKYAWHGRPMPVGRSRRRG